MNYKSAVLSDGIYVNGVKLTDKQAERAVLYSLDEIERKIRNSDKDYAFVVHMPDENAKDAEHVTGWKRNRLDENVKIAVLNIEDIENPKLIAKIGARKYLDHKDRGTIKETIEKDKTISAVSCHDKVFLVNEGLLPASHSSIEGALFQSFEDGDEKGSDIYAGITIGSATDDLSIEQFIMIDDEVARYVNQMTERSADERDEIDYERSPFGTDWSQY